MNSYVTGSLIKKLREEKGLTQNSLAEKLGVSDKTISKWETGKGYPDISLLEPLSNVLNVSLVELLSGNEIKNNNSGFNMKHSKIYVCPICRNIIIGSGDALVCCHGITLFPEQAEKPDQEHNIKIECVEDEFYVTLNHDMTKKHYISFIAAISDSEILFKKLYPEQNAEARFKINKTHSLLFFCNHHGLFEVNL